MKDTGANPEAELTPAFLRFEPPRFSKERLLEEAERLFGVTGTLRPLEGERDQNHRLTTSDGRAFVLKVSGAREDPGVVDFQIRALQHLERAAPDLPVPRVMETRAGEPAGEIEGANGERHKVRLLTYLPGIPHDEGDAPDLEGIEEIGRFGGRLSRAFAGFTHPLARHFMPWDLTNGLMGSKVLWAYGDEDIRIHEAELRPLYARLLDGPPPGLRVQVAHCDLHRGNLLRPDEHSGELTGIIDFGDMVEAPIVCDLAILAGSFALEDGPVEATAAILEGYHAACPLTAEEVKLLPDLITARMVQTALLTDFRIKATDFPPDFILRFRPVLMGGLARWLGLDHRALRAHYLDLLGLQN